MSVQMDQNSGTPAHVTPISTLRVNYGTPAQYLDVIHLTVSRPSKRRGPEMSPLWLNSFCRFHSDVTVICHICESHYELPGLTPLYLILASYW